jgi:hypothetical protein
MVKNNTNMKTYSMRKLFVAIGLLVANYAGYAQTNLGTSCGCPPVASRPTVLMSTLAVSGGANDGDLLANTILNCSKTYILDKKIYVPNGVSLTINPGTVIKGRFQAAATDATALIVQRGGKIFASGERDCQIVFTAEADPLDGTYPIANKGMWGGVVLSGKATNNLTLAANGPFQAGVGDGRLCVADGIGTFEGFASTNSRDQFGATPGSFDDNDNSGILRYVSIRHAGAILQVGGEINALTLGSVGRGTQIDHIEVVSSADDGIEFFGGTVNVKYYTSLFGNDDMFDWDDGYTGKVQFVFGLKTDNTASVDADNGFEMDADDQKSNLLPRSHPVIYNVTMIGNNKSTLTSDNSGLAAIEAKELTEGEIYNSVFANWRYGFNPYKALGTRTGASESWHNWANAGGNGSQSLKVICNTFMNVTNGLAIDKNAAGGTGSAADITQFLTTDKNEVVGSIAGFDNVFTVNNNTNAVAHQYDAIPNPALSTTGCPSTPADGFFTTAPYRGAFAPTGDNWLSPWAYAAVLAITPGLGDCPTDINNDGVTNNVDFLQLLGKFNQSCQ